MADPVQAPAIGVSITENLEGTRQIVLQGFFAADAPEAEANALVDRMFRVADRQKAYYDLDGLAEELRKHQATLGNFLEDLGRIEAKHRADQDGRKEDIVVTNKEFNRVFDEGYDAFRKSGRQGSYEPKGSARQRLNALKANVIKIEGDMKKAESEREVALGGLNTSIARYREEIARIESEMDKRRALLHPAP